MTKGMKLYWKAASTPANGRTRTAPTATRPRSRPTTITMLSSKNGDDDSEASSRKAAAKPVAKKATNEADAPFDDEIPF